MILADLLTTKGLKPAELARRVGCSKSYLSHVLANRKPLGRPVAIRIWRETGVKVDPIANVTDEDIAAFERMRAA